MADFSLIDLVSDHYGSKHYLFRVVNYNGFTLPVDWDYGDLIELPPRGNRRKLADAERRRKTMTYDPVGSS